MCYNIYVIFVDLSLKLVNTNKCVKLHCVIDLIIISHINISSNLYYLFNN